MRSTWLPADCLRWFTWHKLVFGQMCPYVPKVHSKLILMYWAY